MLFIDVSIYVHRFPIEIQTVFINSLLFFAILIISVLSKNLRISKQQLLIFQFIFIDFWFISDSFREFAAVFLQYWSLIWYLKI